MKIPAVILTGLLGGLALTAAASPASNQSDVELQRTMQDDATVLRGKLLTSSSPRDRALGATMVTFDVDVDDRGNNHRISSADKQAFALQLHQAARDVAHDVVVQWLAARSIPASPEAIEILKRVEPDNAAVWLLVLAHANESHEQAQLDDALARMAASSRFDEHYGDMVHAWIEVYTRFPAKPIRDSGMPNDVAVGMALAQTVAMPLPHMALLRICTTGPGEVPTGEGGIHSTSELRRAQCERIGRFMLNEADTMISRTFGYGLLSSLGQDVLTEADRAMKRDLQWYTHASAENYGNSAARDAFAMDWRSQRSEIEVITRALRRAGLPGTAPADWVNPFPG